MTVNAAALGLFDGVHLGHRSVLARANALGICHAVTFAAETIPQKQGHTVRYLYGTAQKTNLLKKCGAASVLAPDFSELCRMDGFSFCREILQGQLHADVVVCGADYRFGNGASCSADDLRHFGEMLGFSVEIVPQICDESGTAISSSRIRGLLEAGNITAANRLLGDDYCIESSVVTGRQLGRTMGFPTANQAMKTGQCVPKFGVYASFADLHGAVYPSITNIGLRPTVERSGDVEPVAETHLLGFSGELTGVPLRVSLCAFLRAEHRFDSLAALTAQIRKDTAQRKALLSYEI